MADQATRHCLLDAGCWLCGRPLGQHVQWHHPVPKSHGGRHTVPVHPICHSTLHATFSNRELDDIGNDVDMLKHNAEIVKFLRWIKNKPADFHAPTRRRKDG